MYQQLAVSEPGRRAANAAHVSRDSLEPMTVLVAHRDPEVAHALRAELAALGFRVLVRFGAEGVLDTIAALDPQVVVLDPAEPAMDALSASVRCAFAHVYIVAYTRRSPVSVRASCHADLVLPQSAARVFALQLRCWSRYV